MKTIFRSFAMVSFYVVLAGFLSSAVCEGNDELDCAALTTKYATKAQEVANSISNGGQLDCNEISDLYNEFFDLLRKGKNCENIKTAIQAAGFNSVDDFITEYEVVLSDIGC
jgi:hypothetical protein